MNRLTSDELGRFCREGDSDEANDLLGVVCRWGVGSEREALRHPHGFWVLPVVACDEAVWRLHIWPKGPRRVFGIHGAPHTHIGDMYSRVIAGAICSRRYGIQFCARASDGLPVYSVRYVGDRHSGSCINQLCRTGRFATVDEVDREVLLPGEGYHLPHGTFHSVCVEEGIRSATIVQVPRKLDGFAEIQVLGQPQAPPSYRFCRPLVPQEDLERELLGFIEGTGNVG